MLIGRLVLELPITGKLVIWGHTKNTIANEIHRVYVSEDPHHDPIPEEVRNQLVDSIWGDADGINISYVTERFIHIDV